MNVWAHRGCSYRYPENTISAFNAASKLQVTGIELDIQLTRDGEMVVMHDELVDRTTDGTGWVRDMSLAQISHLRIETGITDDIPFEHVPTFTEVLDAILPTCRDQGMLVNVELKTSVIRYEGIEEKALAEVLERNLENNVLWSSFCMDSIKVIRRLAPRASVGVLGERVSTCMELAKELGVDAIHPYVGARDVSNLKSTWTGPVRAWNMGADEPFYPSNLDITKLDLEFLEQKGITDLFTNAPELYVGPRE